MILLKKKMKSRKLVECGEDMIMMAKDLLLITGRNAIGIINVNNYEFIRTIEVPGAIWVMGVCMLNQNMLLTGDCKGNIRQWKIEVDNLILVSKKEKAHDSAITKLLNLGNGNFLSGSEDKTIKIW